MSLLYELIGRVTVFLVRYRLARDLPPQRVIVGALVAISLMALGVVTALATSRPDPDDPDSPA